MYTWFTCCQCVIRSASSSGVWACIFLAPKQDHKTNRLSPKIGSTATNMTHLADAFLQSVKKSKYRTPNNVFSAPRTLLIADNLILEWKVNGHVKNKVEKYQSDPYHLFSASCTRLMVGRGSHETRRHCRIICVLQKMSPRNQDINFENK